MRTESLSKIWILGVVTAAVMAIALKHHNLFLSLGLLVNQLRLPLDEFLTHLLCFVFGFRAIFIDSECLINI